jgi:hypothetical protein
MEEAKKAQFLNRIFAIKEGLEHLKQHYLTESFEQDSNFVRIKEVDKGLLKDLDLYPIEYRTFLELIGEINIAECDCFMIEVSLPLKLEESDNFWTYDREIMENENLRVIVFTDNDEIFHVVFDVSSTPFIRYCPYDGFCELEFLDIVEEKVDSILWNNNLKRLKTQL